MDSITDEIWRDCAEYENMGDKVSGGVCALIHLLKQEWERIRDIVMKMYCPGWCETLNWLFHLEMSILISGSISPAKPPSLGLYRRKLFPFIPSPKVRHFQTCRYLDVQLSAHALDGRLYLTRQAKLQH
jgi:hypothetical protein